MPQNRTDLSPIVRVAAGVKLIGYGMFGMLVFGGWIAVIGAAYMFRAANSYRGWPTATAEVLSTRVAQTYDSTSNQFHCDESVKVRYLVAGNEYVEAGTSYGACGFYTKGQVRHIQYRPEQPSEFILAGQNPGETAPLIVACIGLLPSAALLVVLRRRKRRRLNDLNQSLATLIERR